MRSWIYAGFAALGCASSPDLPGPARSDVPAVDAPGVDVPAVDLPAVDVPGVDAGDAPQIAADVSQPRDVADVAVAPLRVLFIGNSYTFYNSLPTLVSRIAAESARRGRGPVIMVDGVTVGGASFRSHWEGGTASERINAGPWSAVVLQAQSVEPALNFDEFRTYALRFTTLLGERGVRPVFFATWARRAGDAVYAQPWSGGNPEAFTTRLDTAYAQVAGPASATVARVGVAWSRALREAPMVNLFDPDGSHPSAAGSWLAACVIYRALTGVAAAPEADVAAPMIAADAARALREIAASD